MRSLLQHVCSHLSQFVPRMDTTNNNLAYSTGRIWWLRIRMGPHGMWRVESGLSEHSLPVRQGACTIFLGARRGKPGSVNEQGDSKRLSSSGGSKLLAPSK